jgi:hypothetical protein
MSIDPVRCGRDSSAQRWSQLAASSSSALDVTIRSFSVDTSITLLLVGTLFSIYFFIVLIACALVMTRQLNYINC